MSRLLGRGWGVDCQSGARTCFAWVAPPLSECSREARSPSPTAPPLTRTTPAPGHPPPGPQLRRRAVAGEPADLLPRGGDAGRRPGAGRPAGHVHSAAGGRKRADTGATGAGEATPGQAGEGDGPSSRQSAAVGRGMRALLLHSLCGASAPAILPCTGPSCPPPHPPHRECAGVCGARRVAGVPPRRRVAARAPAGPAGRRAAGASTQGRARAADGGRATCAGPNRRHTNGGRGQGEGRARAAAAALCCGADAELPAAPEPPQRLLALRGPLLAQPPSAASRAPPSQATPGGPGTQGRGEGAGPCLRACDGL